MSRRRSTALNHAVTLRHPFRILFRLFFAAICAITTARAQDFQSWNEVDISAAWRRVDLLAPLVARVDPTLPYPQLAATGLTADIKLIKSLTLTPGYLYADLPQNPTHVHVPLIALTAVTRRGRFVLADRNRFEKLIGYTSSPWRYRNRILLDRSLGPRDRAHAFVDDEVLINLSAADFNQNRLQMGAGTRLNPRLGIDLYYLRRDPATGSTTHVFGCTLRLAMTSLKPPLSSHTP